MSTASHTGCITMDGLATVWGNLFERQETNNHKETETNLQKLPVQTAAAQPGLQQEDNVTECQWSDGLLRSANPFFSWSEYRRMCGWSLCNLMILSDTSTSHCQSYTPNEMSICSYQVSVVTMLPACLLQSSRTPARIETRTLSDTRAATTGRRREERGEDGGGVEGR